MALQLPWDKLLVASVVSHVEGDKGPQILAYDDTVEGKAGKETSKVGYFFSSIAGKAIKSVAFGVLGLVSVNEGSSVVVDFEQLEQDKKKALVNKAKKAAKAKAKEGGSAPSGRKAGRPKGSKNKDKIADAKEQSQSLQVLERLLKNVMPVLASVGVVPSYLAADGAFGNLACMLTAQSQGLFLVSKLHCNSALYYPPKAGSKKRKFGERVDFGKLGAHEIGSEKEKGCILTYFQIDKVRTKNISIWINVVIIRYECQKTNKTAFVLLFSNDLGLVGMDMVKYYSLRFQIEFNFRDAKQYFGLSDFKSTKPTQVTNAVGLSFFMVNMSAILLRSIKAAHGFDFVSILDIKACFRAVFYAEQLKNHPDLGLTNILAPENAEVLTKLGVINIHQKARKTQKAA